MAAYEHLKREQLDARMKEIRALSEVGAPRQGWIRTVREAMGMSIRQLGARVGLSKSSIAALERRETEGGITLDSLQRLAEGLESDVWYAVVPRRPVQETLQARAREVAEDIVAELRNRMEFEMREIPEEELRSMVAHHAQKALEAEHRLWDELP